MEVFRGRCKKTIIEDNVLLFEEGKTYELVRYEHGEIQGRSETDQYITVSDSGSWKFRDYFSIVL